MRWLFAAVAAVSLLVLAAFFYMDGSIGRLRSADNVFREDSLAMPGSGMNIPKGRNSDFMKPRKPRDYGLQSRNLEPVEAGQAQEASGDADKSSAPGAPLSSEGVQSVQAGPSHTGTDKFMAVPSRGKSPSASASAGLFNPASAGSGPSPQTPRSAAEETAARVLAPARRADPPQAAAVGSQRALGSPAKAPGKGPLGSASLPSASAATSGGETGAPSASPISGTPLTGGKSPKEGSPGGGQSGGGGGSGSPGASHPPVEYCQNSGASVDALSRQRGALRDEIRLLEDNAGKPGLKLIIKMDENGSAALRNSEAPLNELSGALSADSAFFMPEFPAEAQEMGEVSTSVQGTLLSARQGSLNLTSGAASLTTISGQTDMPQDSGQSALGHNSSVSGFSSYNQTSFSLANIQSRHTPRAAALTAKLEPMTSHPKEGAWARDGLGRLARQKVLLAQARAALADSAWDYLNSFDQATAGGLPEAIRARRDKVRAIHQTLQDMNMPASEARPINEYLNGAYTDLSMAETQWSAANSVEKTARPINGAQGSDRTLAALSKMNKATGVIQTAQDKKQACTPPPPPAPPPSGGK